MHVCVNVVMQSISKVCCAVACVTCMSKSDDSERDRRNGNISFIFDWIVVNKNRRQIEIERVMRERER